MKDGRKTILNRLYGMYVLLLVFAVAIVYKLFAIQFIESTDWEQQGENQTTALRTQEAVRGNIYADDGSLLATSIPIYEVRMDPNTDALTDEIFYQDVDRLARGLAHVLPNRNATQWKNRLKKARKDGQRFHLIARNIKYDKLQELETLPIFDRGRYRGGFIAIQQNKRERPFRHLAARTIGYDRNGANPVGLEGAYRNQLRGVDGSQLMQKISGGVWMPLKDENEVEPQDGSDLHTTIDINIQDVAEQALMEQLVKQGADHGCVVLMEVQTGHVKAIANLSKGEDESYYEHYNYAVGESTEPGSTFKLASLIAALEDGLVDLDDTVDTEDGTHKFYDEVMRDSHEGGYGVITLQRAIEVSSNVGISKVMDRIYGRKPREFIDRLYSMNLASPLKLEIYGEGKPEIKTPDAEDWSGISVPWMSIGYEVRLTPMQILAFYNAIANDGVMVKPLLVKNIKQRGKVIREFDPVVLNSSICKKSTVDKVKKALEGVVERGTAMNLRNANYKIAGKTGTAQIANDKYGYKYESKVSHQASFVGYFPAEAPKYTCIVVVNAPSKNVYYGNLVAGPIFKEIADKVYATKIEIHDALAANENTVNRMPYSKNGYRKDLKNVFASLNVPVNDKSPDADFVVSQVQDEKVALEVRRIKKGLVPNVLGMGARDAIHILENHGVKVKLEGRGVVTEQSLNPGDKLSGNDFITLRLAS